MTKNLFLVPFYLFFFLRMWSRFTNGSNFNKRSNPNKNRSGWKMKGKIIIDHEGVHSTILLHHLFFTFAKCLLLIRSLYKLLSPSIRQHDSVEQIVFFQTSVPSQEAIRHFYHCGRSCGKKSIY